MWWAGSGGGAEVSEACPDLSSARMIFNVLRGAKFAAEREADWEHHRELLKPEIQVTMTSCRKSADF